MAATLQDPAVGLEGRQKQREKSRQNDKEGNLVIREVKCLFYIAAAPNWNRRLSDKSFAQIIFLYEALIKH